RSHDEPRALRHARGADPAHHPRPGDREPVARALPAALPAFLGSALMDSTDLTHDGAEPTAADHAAESADARRLADRYRLAFVDMDQFRIDGELFRSIPGELMLRYGFVPWRREGKALVVVVSDPRDQPMFDELSALLSTPLKVAVGARSAIQSMLKKSESSQR